MIRIILKHKKIHLQLLMIWAEGESEKTSNFGISFGMDFYEIF